MAGKFQHFGNIPIITDRGPDITGPYYIKVSGYAEKFGGPAGFLSARPD